MINRLPELRQAIESMASAAAKQKALAPAIDVAGETILRYIREFAPVGSVEPDYQGFSGNVGYNPASRLPGFYVSHGRPSMRLNGITLDAGWNKPQVDNIPNGVSLNITSEAPHARILLDGSPSHPISPRNVKRLSFWWGSPLRWHSTSNPTAHAAMFESVVHPGFRPFNYVQDAMNRGGTVALDDAMVQGRNQLLSRLRTLLGS